MIVDLEGTINLNKEFEGFSPTPYLDVVNVPTIGYGSTYYPDGRKVSLEDPPITEEQAKEMMEYKLRKTFLPSVIRLCPVLLAKALMEGDLGKINSLCSFVYNLGAGNLQISTLRRLINQSRFEEAAEEFIKWNKAGGKVYRGLTRRRLAEKQLYLSQGHK